MTVVFTAVKTNAVCLSARTPIGTSWLISKTDRLYLRVTSSGIRSIAAECWDTDSQNSPQRGCYISACQSKKTKQNKLVYLLVHHEYKKGNLKLGMLLC